VGARIHLKFQLVRDERIHLLRADGDTCLVRLVQLQLDPTLESNFTIEICKSPEIDYALAEFDEIPPRVFAQITGAAQLWIEILPVTHCQSGSIFLDRLHGIQAHSGKVPTSAQNRTYFGLVLSSIWSVISLGNIRSA